MKEMGIGDLEESGIVLEVELPVDSWKILDLVDSGDERQNGAETRPPHLEISLSWMLKSGRNFGRKATRCGEKR